MDQPLFDIVSTGQLVDGLEPQQIIDNLARLFKTSPDKVARFVDGNSHRIKSGIDKATALQYKAALHKAGLMVSFNTQQTSPKTPEPQTPTTATAESPSEENTNETGALTLAPAGTEVLREDERQSFETRDIDTSALQLSSPFQEQATATETDSANAPDTSHISVAETGSDLNPDRPAPEPEPVFELDDWDLAPPGADLEQLPDERPQLSPDTSQLSVAPAGSDLLDSPPDNLPAAPDTSHLSISDEQP